MPGRGAPAPRRHSEDSLLGKKGNALKPLKQGLALLLAAVMLLGMVPAGAAEEPENGIVIEAEDASPQFVGSWGNKDVKTTGDAECSGGKFCFVQKNSAPSGEYVEFTAEVPADGTYDIYVTTKDNKDRTGFQFSVNGEDVGNPVDLYLAGPDAAYREHKIGAAELKAGAFKLRATALEKSAAGLEESANRGGVFDFFRLVPAAAEKPDVDPEAPIFFEDFEGDACQFGLADGWSVVDNGSSKVLQGTKMAAAGLLNRTSDEFHLPETYTISYDFTMLQNAGRDGWSGGIVFEYNTDNDFYHFRFNKSDSVSNIQLMKWPDPNQHVLFQKDYPFQTGAGTSHNLCLVNEGGTARFYVDGELLAENIAISTSGKGLGLRVYNGAMQFDNVTVWDYVREPEAVPGGPIYQTGFDTLPKELEGSAVWGLVELKEGRALGGACTGNNDSLVQLTSAGTLPTSYTLVVDMALMGGITGNGYSAGLTFRHEDSKEFYHFRLDNGTGMSAQLFQWTSGAGNKLASTPVAITDGEARRLRVTVDDAKIICYLDGRQVAEYAGSASGGNVGFRLYNAEALFDNLAVYSGVVEPPAEGEYAQAFRFPEETETIYNNEQTDHYREKTGEWSSLPGAGQDSSDARTAGGGGAAAFSAYPPKSGQQNYSVDWYVPAADGDAADFTIQTLDGMWKFTLPAGTAAGWHRLGVVTATGGTAFTVDAASQGRLYADAVKLTPTTAKADPVYTPTGGGSEEIAVLVNQIGYDTGTSKRATVPNAEDGAPFQVIHRQTEAVVFSGVVENNIADFTQLDTDADTDFYITCGGAESYVFTIGENIIQRRSVKNALAFMDEVRSDTFCVGSNSIAWRDSHQFSFELNGLVLQYMANPALQDSLTGGITNTATCEYEALRVQDEPDIIWLIQFAALRYYDWGHDEGRDLHMLTKEQLAYYLYLYPEISEYVPEETYRAIRDYTISVWGNSKVSGNSQWYAVSGTDHNLYSVQTVFGGLKGSQPPGHSIVPNLLMYEVAKRDGLGDDVAQRFFDAAYANCEYTIHDIDINDPFYNKGQRMSEYVTVPALAWFLEMYPDRAPGGLKAALESWAEKTIARSDNMWDIRMAVSLEAGDGVYYFHNPKLQSQALTKDYWTGAAYANADDQAGYLAGGAPKNEPGNQAGLQAVTYAAARVLEDGAAAGRLKELGVAAIDDLYGRNPTGRAAFYDFTRDFEGADLGWYKQFAGGAGVLERRTAVIDANAPELCYPYAPENYNTGYTEGWVAYNTAWNASLAYAAADAVSLAAPVSGKQGEAVTLTLNAPLNLDTAVRETGYVFVTNPLTGERAKVEVAERGTDSAVFEGTYVLPNAPYVTVSYGSGIFLQSADVTVSDYVGVPAAEITLSGHALALAAGETVRLSAAVLPADATDKRVSFTSLDSGVASVTADGLVRAVGAGQTVITAASVSDPAIKAECTVTVAAAAPQSLRVSAPSELSAFGSQGKIEVTGVVYSDGTVKTGSLPEAVFSTGDGGILRVDPDGTLTGLAAGKATVTAAAVVEGRTVTGAAEVTVTAERSFDLLTLYREGRYTADGVTMAIAANTKDDLTSSYGTDRLKLTGNQAGNTVAFQLGELAAGTYSVTLFSKYYGDKYAYGTWSFRIDGKTVGTEIDFDQADKNGTYHDIPLGGVELGAGEHTFTFVSSDGGPVVPVSVTLSLDGGTDPGPDPEVKPGQTTPKIHAMDEMYKKVYTDASIQAAGLNYRLYVPAGYEHGQEAELPLLIYLNGAGSRGTDNVKQLANLSPLITPLIDDPDHPCIIAVPQLPTSDKWVNVDWALGSYEDSVPESNSAKLLMGLIGELKQAYKVDPDRVYLMGQSFGGYGAWDLITRHPETFAAAVPMCGAGSPARAEAVKDMPLLVLHGAADPTVPVSGSREMTAALKAAGSTSVTYLEYEGDDHYVQRRLFEQPELYLDWLFSQEKGKTPAAPDVSGLYMPRLTLNLNGAEQLDRLTVTGGTAKVEGGQMTLTPADGGSSALALAKGTEGFRDGVLTAHFTMDALTGSGGAGLVLRARDGGNYIHIRFTKNGLELLEMVNGKAARSNTVPYTLTAGRITCMKAEVRGSVLSVWVDNKLLFDRAAIQAAALQESGAVGVRSYGVPVRTDDIIWSTRGGAYIALTSMADRQVYQRDAETGTGAVALTGTAEGAARLRWRVVSWDGGDNVIHAWTETPVTDGGFSADFTVPQGGWYKTELEALDAGGERIARAESGRWGVGINILCIGQSNMVGIGQGAPEAAHDLASNFMNEHWTHLEDPYDKGDTTPISSDGTVGNSMVPALVNALIEAYGLPVGIIPAARGGAGLVCDCADYPRWLDRSEDNPADRTNLYGNSLYRARAAGGVELIVMNQGEHDVSGNTGEEAYLAALKTLVDNYRRDLGRDVPFFYCQLGPARPGSWSDEKGAVMDGIRAAQMRFNDPEQGVILAAVEMDLDRNSDNLHYTTASQSVIGRRVANAIRWYYDTAPDRADYYTGPGIAAVRFADAAGTKLDVTLAHTGGSDFTPAAGITGFEAADGVGSLEITSAVRKDAHTITLTLARPAEGGTRVRYMAGLLPDVTGIVKDNSPMRLPLNATVGWLEVTGRVESVTLDCTEATLYTNGENTLRLTAEVLPAGLEGAEVSWTSGDEAVATVDDFGLVTAVADGTVVITAAVGGKSAQCTITVSTYYTAPARPPVKIETAPDGSVAAVMTPNAAVSGGQARVSLTTADVSRLTAAAEKSGGTEVVIRPKVRGTADRFRVSIPAGGAAKLAGYGLTVELPAAEVTIPAGGLAGHEGGLVMTAALTENGGLSVSTGLNTLVRATWEAPAEGNVVLLVLDDGSTRPLALSRVEQGTATALIPGGATVALGQRSASFPDVPEGSWAADAVGFAAVRGLFGGAPGGAFVPGEPMTRAMLAVVLARMDGREASGGAGRPWYGGALSWAVENGILQGSGGDLNPDGALTREQLCTILARYAGHAGLTLEQTDAAETFSDSGAVSGWAAGSVEFCLRAGLLTGRPGGRMDPKGQATRAEIAVIMTRFIEAALR